MKNRVAILKMVAAKGKNLVDKLNRARDYLHEITLKNKEKEQEFAQLEKQLEDRREIVSRLEKGLDAREVRVKEIERDLSVHTKEIKQRKQDLDKIESAITNQRVLYLREKEKLVKDCDKLDDEQKKLTKSIKSLTAEKKEMQKATQDMDKHMKKSLTIFEKKDAQILAKEKQLEKDLMHFDSMRQRNIQDLEIIGKKKKAFMELITKLEAKEAALNYKDEQIKQEKYKALVDRDNLLEEVKRLHEVKNGLEADIGELKSFVKSEEKRLSVMKFEAESLKKEADKERHEARIFREEYLNKKIILENKVKEADVLKQDLIDNKKHLLAREQTIKSAELLVARTQRETDKNLETLKREVHATKVIKMQNTKLQHGLQEQERDLETREKELARRESEVTSIIGKQEELHSREVKIQSREKVLAVKEAATSAQISQASMDMNASQRKLKELEEREQNVIASENTLAEKISAHEADRKELAERFKAMKAKEKTSETIYAQLMKKKKEYDSENGRLTTINDKLNDKEKELKAKELSLQRELLQLRNTETSVEKKEKSLLQDVKSHQLKIQQLSNKETVLLEIEHELKTREKNLKDHIRGFEKKLKFSEKKNDGLDAKLVGSAREYKLLQAELQKQNAELTLAKKELLLFKKEKDVAIQKAERERSAAEVAKNEALALADEHRKYITALQKAEHNKNKLLKQDSVKKPRAVKKLNASKPVREVQKPRREPQNDIERYIVSALDSGFTKGHVRDKLKSVGWSDSQVKEVFISMGV